MNSKLRRILRRRRSNENDSKKKRGNPPLPSLLSQERPKAEPNFYLSNDQTGDRHQEKDKDEKDKLKEVDHLIVNTDSVAIPREAKTAQQESLIISLQPLGESNTAEKRNLPESHNNKALNQMPNLNAVQEIDQSMPNQNKAKRSTQTGRLECGFISEPPPSCLLHNNVPRASYTTENVMQRSIPTESAKSLNGGIVGFKTVFCSSLVTPSSGLEPGDCCLASANSQDNWADFSNFEMKRSRWESIEQKCDRGRSCPSCDATAEATMFALSCDSNKLHYKECQARRNFIATNAISSTPLQSCVCEGPSQRVVDIRHQQHQQQGAFANLHVSPCCRTAHGRNSTPCPDRPLQVCCCSNTVSFPCGETPQLVQRSRRAAIFFTIVDDDAMERRPRILEFASRSKREDVTFNGECIVSCDGHQKQECMDWCEEELVCSHNSSHCLAPDYDRLQFSQVNSIACTPAPHPSTPSMAPSVGFFNQIETPAATQQTNGIPSSHRCRCRKWTQAPSRFRLRHHHARPGSKRSGNNDTSDPASTSSTCDITSLAHFELSKRSYAKLIAYSHARGLLNEMQPDLAGESDRNSDFVSSKVLRHETYPRSDVSGSASSSSAGFFDSSSPSYDSGVGSNDRHHQPTESAKHICRLAQVFETVEDCPWYYGPMSGQEAEKKLRGSPQGTFLLRDSSNSRYLFSLSLMSKYGATSIRIINSNGLFHFDSEVDASSDNWRSQNKSKKDIRRCVISMILHYTGSLSSRRPAITSMDSDAPSGGLNSLEKSPGASGGDGKKPTASRQFVCYWMDRGSRKEISIQLSAPLGNKLPSLKQICRLSLNRQCRLWENPKKLNDLPLPFSLKNYVRKYPYPE